jgi:hypothetical protein
MDAGVAKMPGRNETDQFQGSDARALLNLPVPMILPTANMIAEKVEIRR